MICMSTYAERLAWAMSVRGMTPHSDQSELARRVGMGCKPQNIQHLLDPNKNAKFSKYTARIAEVLKVDPQWLAYETGTKPQPDLAYTARTDEASVADVKHPPGQFGRLEEAQRRAAEEILSRLSGGNLTKALAFLQDLEGGATQVPRAPGDEGGLVVEGGHPDPVPVAVPRRTTSK